MSKKSSIPAAEPTEESSQHIWLAGLGAMAKAQSQGTQAFEALIADGLAFQRKTHAAAQEKIKEATQHLSHLANDFGQQTSGRIDRLEHLFEDRVARALTRLGMPTLADIQALQQRVADLESQLAAKVGSQPTPKTPATKATAQRSKPKAR
jgi:poly(hydroxyalkanoate) granule-associated protein